MGSKRFPRDFSVAEVKRVGGTVGGVPTMDQFRELSSVAPETLGKRFGGWRKAVSAAGFDPSLARLTYHDFELVAEVRRQQLLHELRAGPLRGHSAEGQLL